MKWERTLIKYMEKCFPQVYCTGEEKGKLFLKPAGNISCFDMYNGMFWFKTPRKILQETYHIIDCGPTCFISFKIYI